MENNSAKINNKITITDENGEKIDLYVLEETKFNGMNYMLATDAEGNEDGECYILKDVSAADESEAILKFVEDDAELDYMTKIFVELMEGEDITIE